MQTHFSVNAASELLERNRRTVKRALRDTPPDSFERKQPRWKLSKIVAALDRNADRPANHNGGNGNDLDDQCKAAFAKFDAAYEKMKALPSLAKRREMSIEFAPNMIAEAVHAMKARDTADGLHEEHVDLRGERIYFLMMIGFETPCSWTRDQVWDHLCVGDDA